RGRRTRLRGAARRRRKALRSDPAAHAAAGADGRLAYLGDVAWRRLFIWSRRCGAAHLADVARRAAGSPGAGLSARPRGADGATVGAPLVSASTLAATRTAPMWGPLMPHPGNEGVSQKREALDRIGGRCKCYLHSHREVQYGPR